VRVELRYVEAVIIGTIVVRRAGDGWIEPHTDLPLYRAIWGKLAGWWMGLN
jgi:hypothetical protein